MTQNEVSIIKNSVLDATEAYVDARLSVADFVKTQIGVVVSATQDSSTKKWKHTVRCNATPSNPNGITYTNVLSINNIHFTDNSVVFIVAPNAQFSNQFILGKLDNVPYDITAGSIHIGQIGTSDTYYFNVDSNGNLSINDVFTVTNQGVVTIKNGSINLTKKTSSSISTDTYNFIVNSSGIKLGAYVKDNGSSANPRYTWAHYFNVDSNGKVNITKGSININDKFYVDDTGNLYLGGTSTGSANFYVTNAGKVTIKSGSITLGSVFKVDETGWLAIGGTSSTANFYVNTSGSVTIKSGSILLNQYGSTSHYNVDINSTGIGVGWNGASHNFSVAASDGSVTIKKGSINIADKFYADASGNLYVGGTSTTTAKFYVTNTGELHSTSGSIGGFKITNNALGDAIGSDTCVGMISGQKLFAWSSGRQTEITFGQIYLGTGSTTNGIRVYASSSFGGNYMQYGFYDVYSSARDDRVAFLNDISDERLKKNIKSLSSQSIRTFFDKLNPVQFKFKKEAEEDNNTHFGIIAQNLDESFDNAELPKDAVINIRQRDNIMRVNYREFHGLELAAIKDLYSLINEQQEKINFLEKELEEIRKV